MNNRIIVLTNGNYFAKIILEKLFEEYHADIVGVLVVTGDYKGRSKLKALYELSKVTALPYLLFKILQKFVYLVLKIIKPGVSYDVESLAKKYQIPVKNTISISTDSSYNWVKEKKPDLLVSVSCPQIIKKRYLELGSFGGINIHSSLLPKYAGLAPYFWVLANDEKETGVTVHYMTLKFDQGNILKQEKLPIFDIDSAHNLFLRLAELGNQMLAESVDLVFDGFNGTCQNLENYSYYSHPSNAAYKSLCKNGHTLIRFSDIINAFRGGVT